MTDQAKPKTLTTHKPITATCSCAHCDWTCRMTGIRVEELGQALKDALIDHILATHPEAFHQVPS